VLELAEELGISICYWNVMDSGKRLCGFAEQIARSIRHPDLIMFWWQNQLRDEHFNILEFSGVKDRGLGFDARVITIKRLHAPAMTKIDSNSYSFWAAKNKDPDSLNALGLLERQRVKSGLNHAIQRNWSRWGV